MSSNYKHLFPLSGFVVLSILVLAIAIFEILLPSSEIDWVYVISTLFVGLAISSFWFVIHKKLTWDVADEVWDCGDDLLIPRNGVEERIPFTRISYGKGISSCYPPIVTLTFDKPTIFARQIRFYPISPLGFIPLRKETVSKDLINRIS
jgi:hypothetical protein